MSDTDSGAGSEPGEALEAVDGLEAAGGGRLAENIMHFARVLRAAGLAVGPGQMLDAVAAVSAAGIGRRDDFYWMLHAVFVKAYRDRALFDQAFHVFWRRPDLIDQMMQMMLPELAVPVPKDKQPAAAARLAQAMFPENQNAPEREMPEVLEVDAELTYSGAEVLAEKDFEQMSVEEQADARRAIARLDLMRARVATRRFRRDPHGGRVDMRATLRASLRGGGKVISLQRRARRLRPPPIVALCDISGSMTQYSRMLLHFLHALAEAHGRVHSFVFGTRLTNITRYLRTRDVDVALEAVSDHVDDWSGGTRIGACLKAFNFDWSRRCLGQGAIVLLITDGLDRGEGDNLEAEMDRLQRSCRRLVWLNPLLRYDGFEPKAQGIRAMLPHVDAFAPVHNLKSLEALADGLSRPTRGFGTIEGFGALKKAG